MIDLNADVSEGYGVYRPFESPELYQYITSANIACGFHAGDPQAMGATLARCKALGIQAGAHPGYRDLIGFGRRALALTEAEAVGDLLYQVGALKLIGNQHQHPIRYVKLHGAWYNSAMQGQHADALILALKAAAPDMGWLALSGSPFALACQHHGVKVYHEVFADRAYNDDGSLVPRNQPGAVIEDEAKAIEHVKRMVLDGQVRSLSGKLVSIKADSICIHGDNPHAAAFAERLRYTLENAGVRFGAFGEGR